MKKSKKKKKKEEETNSGRKRRPFLIYFTLRWSIDNTQQHGEQKVVFDLWAHCARCVFMRENSRISRICPFFAHSLMGDKHCSLSNTHTCIMPAIGVWISFLSFIHMAVSYTSLKLSVYAFVFFFFLSFSYTKYSRALYSLRGIRIIALMKCEPWCVFFGFLATFDCPVEFIYFNIIAGW